MQGVIRDIPGMMNQNVRPLTLQNTATQLFKDDSRTLFFPLVLNGIVCFIDAKLPLSSAVMCFEGNGAEQTLRGYPDEIFL